MYQPNQLCTSRLEIRGYESDLTDGIWVGYIRGFQPKVCAPVRFAVIGPLIHWMKGWARGLLYTADGVDPVHAIRISTDVSPENISRMYDPHDTLQPSIEGDLHAWTEQREG